MKSYLTSEIRKKLGELLKGAQRDEIPFTVRLRQDPMCVAAPIDWYNRACRGLAEPPEITRAPSSYEEQRTRIGEYAKRVAAGEFIALPRLEGTACVFVPLHWYWARTKEIGHPHGDAIPTPTGKS